MLTDPRYHTNARRLENNDETNRIVEKWIAQLPREELLEKLDSYGVPVSPVMSIADIFENEQYKARENIVEVKHPSLERLKYQVSYRSLRRLLVVFDPLPLIWGKTTKPF